MLQYRLRKLDRHRRRYFHPFEMKIVNDQCFLFPVGFCVSILATKLSPINTGSENSRIAVWVPWHKTFHLIIEIEKPRNRWRNTLIISNGERMNASPARTTFLFFVSRVQPHKTGPLNFSTCNPVNFTVSYQLR